MKKMLLIFKWLALIALVVAAGVFLFLNFPPTFGGKPDQASLKRIQNSPNFNGTEFVNIEPTVIATRDDNPSWLDWTIAALNPPKGKRPSKPLPTVPLNNDEFKHGSIAWLGHATTLMQIGDKRIMTDPVFYYASPLPESYRDHALGGNWAGFRECHIKPDLLLIYEQDEESIQLVRLGSHSELF